MDVLIYAQNNKAHNLIVTELSNVLSASVVENGEGSQVDEGNDMAVQSVFTLLDTLSSWASKYRLKKSKLVNTCWNKAGECMQKLLDDVPKELLGKAAMRIKAYTRALRYFEISMRENYIIGKKYPISEVADKGQRSLRPSTSTTTLQKTLYGSRNDGSNGVLPTLASDELDYLVTIFSKLEDPDVLQGIQVLRQIQGFPSTPWNRILELQQTDDWLGALVEYGLMDEFKRIDSFQSYSSSASFTPSVKNNQQRTINRSIIRKDTFSEHSNKKQKFDDTPGAERIRTQHKVGTFTEWQPDGTEVHKIVGDGYYITAKDGNVIINGQCNINIVGNAEITVGGDAITNVKGSVKQVIEKDYSLLVKGEYRVSTGGNLNLDATGTTRR
jgi:hypothetical protein